MSLDDTIRCFKSLSKNRVSLTTLSGITRPTVQTVIDGIPQLIAIAEAAEEIILCDDLDFKSTKLERRKRAVRLRDALFPPNPELTGGASPSGSATC